MHFSAKYTALLALSVQLVLSSPIICYQDNPARTLERFSTEAAAFCPKYLAGSSKDLPYYLAELPPTRISSACSCFTLTAIPKPTTSVHFSSTTLSTSPVVTSSFKHSKSSSTPLPTKSGSASYSRLVSSSTKPSSSITVVPVSTKTLNHISTSPSSSITVVPVSTKTLNHISTSPTTTPLYTRDPITFAGKRGIVYDWLSSDFSKFFVGSQKVSFGSDWHATRGETGSTLDSSFGFIPTLVVDRNLENTNWISTVTGLIKGGVKTVFASNEPDNAGQANLSPSDAARVYQKYMMPLRNLGAGLATPAVTNGIGTSGLPYLENFLTYCSGCTFDVINIHHYVPRSDCNVDQAVAAVKNYIDVTVPAVQAKHPQLQGLPVCIGEFWLLDASDEEGAEYLRRLLPYLDAHPRVVCYQAFGGLWKGHFINQDGTGLTASGSVYRDF